MFGLAATSCIPAHQAKKTEVPQPRFSVISWAFLFATATAIVSGDKFQELRLEHVVLVVGLGHSLFGTSLGTEPSNPTVRCVELSSA